MNKYKWQLAGVLVFVAVFSVVSAVAQRSSDSKTFKVSKGGKLIVDADNVSADIHIKAWNKSEVLVKVDGIGEEDMEDLDMRKDGNTVYVEYHGHRGDWRRSRHARFVISVPSEFSLDLATSGGDIDIADRINGHVEAATSGGDIEVMDVDGDLDLATSGGDVSARNVSGDAALATSGGDIDVGEVKGKLDVATSGGDIEVANVGKGIDAKTAGGDIIIGDVGGDADVATAGGDVELGRISGAADLRTAGGDIQVKSATGEVSARTAGGDIELVDIKGFVEAETAGGDIMVELTPSGKRGSTLETKGGDVVLFIPSGAKVTIEAEIRLQHRWDGEHDEYDIMSDFKADSKDRDKRGISAKYVLNGGGPTIRLETMHGDIEIRKLK